MKKTMKQLQDEIIKKYRMTIEENSTCRMRTHVHTKQRKICKWKQCNSVKSTFTLLHEIGHCENNNSKMRRCEQEYYATQWALDRCKEYNIDVPKNIIDRYQRYVYRELDRGQRRGGTNYPTKEQMKLVKECN
jgi:hypothetical protein